MQSLSIFWAMLGQTLLVAWRDKASWLNAWLFFILVVTLFPLAITPDNQLLHTIAPGLIWVAALLSMLLGFNQLFVTDYQDGSLSLLLLSPHSLALLVFAKVTAHWLSSALPLILTTPCLGLLLHLSFQEIECLVLALLLGTPVLSLVGAIVAALTVALENQGLLLALLVLPLCVPVLVFGTGVVINSQLGLNTQGIFALLVAFLTLSFTLAPWAASAALRLTEI